jgi:hypothetical protein
MRCDDFLEIERFDSLLAVKMWYIFWLELALTLAGPRTLMWGATGFSRLRESLLR